MTAARSISRSNVLSSSGWTTSSASWSTTALAEIPVVSLIFDQGIVQMIEAIGLGRRTVGRHLDRLDARIPDAGDRCSGRRIVAVIADEDRVIGIIEALKVARSIGAITEDSSQAGTRIAMKPGLPIAGRSLAKALGKRL